MKHAEDAPETEKDDMRTQELLDMTAPSVIKFETDYFICGNIYRCVQALREHPASIEGQAILKRLEEKDGVTLKIYTRRVSVAEERKIISNVAGKNRLNQSSTNDLQQTVQAESNLQDVAMIVARTHRNREPLLHTVVYMEPTANEYDCLKLLQTEVMTKLIRSKLNVDRFLLRQQQGLQCAMPSGRNVFRDQFERVLPTNSVANLCLFNYSGRTGPHGFYVGRSKFESNILVDFNQRVDDKTNGPILILGNSGQGKSYLLKLVLCNLREAGLNVICLDPEIEYEELTNNLGDCFIDLMGGCFLINPLGPKAWDEGESPEDSDASETFRIRSRISQYVSFLKDFFRSHEDFIDREIDVTETMVQRPRAKCRLTDETDSQRLGFRGYSTLSELYEFIEAEYKRIDSGERQPYTAELLQNILLRLHSMCREPEAKSFNGHTNITDSSFVALGVRGVLQASRNLRDALLFNTLSLTGNRLLTIGDAVTRLDEFYLLLSNLMVIEYAQSFMERVRKKNSSMILASQNPEDFNIERIQEYIKPLLSIPTHQLLFDAGAVDEKFYTDVLQLETSEFNLIRYLQCGVCLYKCGDERYNPMVTIPDYKAKLFGKVGRRWAGRWSHGHETAAVWS